MGVVFDHDALPRDRTVKANGLNFHYLEWGDSGNPTMLLLHGFAQTCHSWDFVALGFSDRFRVIALDQRGHGDSDWAHDGDYSPETQQHDIAAIVSALGLRDFVLMGLSMGGRNSFTYAANHSEQVRGLVVVDAGPENMRAGSENIRRFVQQDDELDSVDAFVERVLSYNPRRKPEQIRGSIMHNLRQLPNGKWTWKYDRALRSPGRRIGSDPETAERLWGYLEALRCPTMIVRGGQSDVIAMDTADRMQARIPDCRIATVERAGHLVMGDNPAGFQQVVTEFIESLG
jgi:pimeloyl-ACP methyl ester carboxylesterase